MKNLWLLLLLLLRPAIGPGDDPADPPPDDPPADDPTDDLDLGGGDDDPPPSDDPPADDPATLRAERDREREATARERQRAENSERELGELRRRSAAPQGQSPEDQIRAQEDARLNAADVTPLEKWQINANRELRSGKSAANAALAEAYDVRDRAAFSTLAVKEPALFKRYETRVEEELAAMRGRGQNAPREAIFTFLLGKDMRDGKFKKKPAAGAGASSTVQRGKLPGARSDTPGRGGQMTEHEKRAKRLENVQI